MADEVREVSKNWRELGVAEEGRRGEITEVRRGWRESYVWQSWRGGERLGSECEGGGVRGVVLREQG